MSRRQLNCTRRDCNPKILPFWQRKCTAPLPQEEQQALTCVLQREEQSRLDHNLKHFHLRNRLRKHGIMTTWESRVSSTTSTSSTSFSGRNQPLTSALMGMPSCFHCLKVHCPIRTIVPIVLPPTPTKNWCLSSKLFTKKSLIQSALKRSCKWKKRSLFMGSARVTVSVTGT